MSLQPHIVRFASLPSTNTEAAQRALAGAAEGLVIVAGEQTAGRGRLDRQWVSPLGAGLYFSILLRPKAPPADWSVLPLMAAVAVHDALVEAFGLETDIKWPNDILAGERKLCGILAEAIESSVVVVGIGINLTADAFPPELKTVATSVQQELGRPPDFELLLLVLSEMLARRYETFCGAAGPVAIINEWTRRSSYASGKRVRVTCVNQEFCGVTRGLESDGALRVETDAGEIKTVRAGDVTSVRPGDQCEP
jgi:BirA family biotin operon repressor/biotin-[acetyl-CoA-carboxylase] ligase